MITSTHPAPARARGTDLRFGEIPPDRPRLGSLEHPNHERPGARQHPALATERRPRRGEHAG